MYINSFSQSAASIQHRNTRNIQNNTRRNVTFNGFGEDVADFLKGYKSKEVQKCMAMVYVPIALVLGIIGLGMYSCNREQSAQKERFYDDKFETTLDSLPISQHDGDMSVINADDFRDIRRNTVEIFEPLSEAREIMENLMIKQTLNTADPNSPKGAETDWAEYEKVKNRMDAEKDKLLKGNQ